MKKLIYFIIYNIRLFLNIKSKEERLNQMSLIRETKPKNEFSGIIDRKPTEIIHKVLSQLKIESSAPYIEEQKHAGNATTYQLSASPAIAKPSHNIVIKNIIGHTFDPKNNAYLLSFMDGSRQYVSVATFNTELRTHIKPADLKRNGNI